MKHLFISCVLMVTVLAAAFAQDTIKVMSYNTLNYGNPSTTSCPGLNTYLKDGYLRDIVAYENPDILGLVKMAGYESLSEDTVMQKVLNVVCPQCYWHAHYTNNSGYSKVDMVYYKINKLALFSTTTLYSADPNIADINLVKLYYLNPDLATKHDTTFLNIILVHLLSTSSNSAQRGVEMQGVMKSLTTNYPALKNYILMGDFNVKTYTEPCFQAAINPSDSNYKFYDAANQLADWHSNPSPYAKYLTVDTRTAALTDCGSNSGMQDWYDHILVTKDILNGTDSVQYVPNSFVTVGQDGRHTSNALTDNPKDTIVPANVLNSLYYMSNHLPVTVKLAINRQKALPLAIKPIEERPALIKFTNPAYTSLRFTLIDNKLAGQKVRVSIYNTLGREIFKSDLILSSENSIDLQGFSSGMYIIRLTENGHILTQSKIVKE